VNDRRLAVVAQIAQHRGLLGVSVPWGPTPRLRGASSALCGDERVVGDR
jgi:hypothetical protein